MIQDIAPDRLNNAYAPREPRAGDSMLVFGEAMGLIKLFGVVLVLIGAVFSMLALRGKTKA